MWIAWMVIILDRKIQLSAMCIPHLKRKKFCPHFKNAVGTIDGTHIPVIVPKEEEIKHMNRKVFTSQNVMAMCDFDMRFTFVVSWMAWICS